jgi:IMP dehydrogenase
VAEVQVGAGKDARRAYGFADLAVVPSRRTRDPEVVDTRWEIDAYELALPVMGAALDSVASPATCIALGRLGGVGVLNLEGVWTRHEDPSPLLARIAEAAAGGDRGAVTEALRAAYAAPIVPELVRDRISELKAAGVTSAAALTPQRTAELADVIVKAELDLFVIRGTVVSAEHVSSRDVEPLNLKSFVRKLDVPVIVGGCASYQAALHLMRTGAAGVIVGVDGGTGSRVADVLGVGVPSATAVADARAARMRHLDETGVYCHVIADGGIGTSADLAIAVVCGADAVVLSDPLAAATEAPGRGFTWEMTAAHPTLPKGTVAATPPLGSLEQVLLGPAASPDGRTNLIGGLRAAMGLCGYASLKELQKAELVART